MKPTFADDLRFALQMVEEYQCLRLDAEYATKLRFVMIRQIERAEADQSRSRGTEPVQI